MLDIDEIQKFLIKENLDGWLIADFHARNHVAVEFLGLSTHLTRRSFFYIPSEGQPTAIVNNIEKNRFEHLPGKKITFSSYKILEQELSRLLGGAVKVAMEYSPFGRLPTVGVVDAGTIELIRSFGIEIVSSADLVACFQARLSDAQIVSHETSAKLVIDIKDKAFAFISESLINKKVVTEYQVVQFILRQFEKNNLICDFPPSVAVNANISNPHYMPDEKHSHSIQEGDLILIDLWAKLNKSQAVYADITWMAYAGRNVPSDFNRIFSIVIQARDTAVDYIKHKWNKGDIYGFEVDDACHRVIDSTEYGEYFYHRTGHSILETVHGPGPNIDGLEAEDRRKLLPGHLFSIEPGIYLPDYGFRSEINCLLTDNGPKITTLPLQTEIIPLLK